MELVFGIIVGLIILVFLVVVHELGHATVAHRNGVVVEEFGVGFPPCAWQKKLKNGVLFTLNWLPLGGFVKLQGEYDSADKKGDYGAVNFWQKTKILLAGVVFNWLLAIVLLSILAVTGLPKILSDQFVISSDATIIQQPVEIVTVIKNHAAEKAGIKVNDVINQFAGQKVTSVDQLIKLSSKNKGTKVMVNYSRGGVSRDVQVALGQDAKTGIFGAGLGQRELIKTTWSAPIVGVATTAQFTLATFQGIGNLFGNLASGLVLQLSSNAEVREKASSDLKSVGDSVAGPVGILGTVFPEAQKSGMTQLTFLTAIISLSLAVMNILPIPALDGGRLFVTAIFRLTKKDLTKEREEKIQTVGFLTLMGLIILVTFVDVSKLF